MARIEEQPGVVAILHNDVIDELNAVIRLLAERLRRFDFSSEEYNVCKATQFAAIGALWILWDRLQALTGDAYNMRKTAQFAALGGLWMKTMDEALGQDVTARRIAFEAAKDIAVAIRQSGDAGPLVEVV